MLLEHFRFKYKRRRKEKYGECLTIQCKSNHLVYRGLDHGFNNIQANVNERDQTWLVQATKTFKIMQKLLEILQKTMALQNICVTISRMSVG